MKKRIFSIISILAFALLLTSCTDMGTTGPTPNKTKTPTTSVITPGTLVNPTPDKTPKTTPYPTPDDVVTPIPTPDTTPDNNDNNTPDVLPDTLIPTPDGRFFDKYNRM